MRLEIDGNYSGIKFSASHFIPGHAKCGHLHGHSYILHLSLVGDKGEDGMIMDFVELKHALKRTVDDLDHKVLLPSRSPHVNIQKGEEIVVLTGRKRYVLPSEDVVILDIAQTSAEELAEHILGRVLNEVHIPPNCENGGGRPGRGKGTDGLGQ